MGDAVSLDTILAAAKQRAEALASEIVTIDIDELDIVLTAVVPANGIFVETLASRAKKSGSRMARALIASQTRSIAIAGELLVNPDTGEPLRFNDPEIWPRLEVSNASDAVVALLGSDIVIARAAKQLMDDVDEDADPI